jgi:hypothetical protein
MNDAQGTSTVPMHDPTPDCQRSSGTLATGAES